MKLCQLKSFGWGFYFGANFIKILEEDYALHIQSPSWTVFVPSFLPSWKRFLVSWGEFLTNHSVGYPWKCCSSPFLSQILHVTWKSYEIYLAHIYIFINSVLRERVTALALILCLFFCLCAHLDQMLHTMHTFIFFPYKLEQHSETAKCGVADSLTDSIREMHFISNIIYRRTCWAA